MSLPDTSLWEHQHSWTSGRSYTQSWEPDGEVKLEVDHGEACDDHLLTLLPGDGDALLSRDLRRIHLKSARYFHFHYLLAYLSGNVPAGLSGNNFTFLSQELSAVLAWDVSSEE